MSSRQPTDRLGKHPGTRHVRALDEHGNDEYIRTREGSGDFEPNVVVFLREPPAPRRIGRIQPFTADEDDARTAGTKPRADGLDEILAGLQRIDIPKDFALTQATLERFVQAPGVAGRVLAAVAEEDRQLAEQTKFAASFVLPQPV
jgi:hypothetical protein